MLWFLENTPFLAFFDGFCAADLATCLPNSPTSNGRPRIPTDALTIHSPFSWLSATVLLTFLAYRQLRRRQKSASTAANPLCATCPPRSACNLSPQRKTNWPPTRAHWTPCWPKTWTCWCNWRSRRASATTA